MSSTDAAPTTSSEPPPQEPSKPQPNPQDSSSPSATTVPSSDVAQSEPETSPTVAPSDVDAITVVASTSVENVERQIDVSAPGNAQDGVGHGAINGEGAQEIVIGHDSSADEGQHWYQEGDNHELKRVKVYELINARWIDQGTAFCFGHYDENTGDALLVARAEASYSEVILQTAIRSSDVYQRQQDTLIVWTEPDGQDYALSFQDPEGCQEVWSFILEVQRIHSTTAESSSPFAGPDSGSITTGSIIRSGHLPSPALGIILEIDKAIKALSRTTVIREKICEYIQRADYLKSMIDVMSQAEDLESLDNLHALCTLMQTILTMNDHAMYEHILEDDLFFGVVGMLEYDPEFPTHKANYREFLRQTTHFHEPVPISDPIISKKIHHTYRLQFLKDVALARILDDSTFNVLNSCIIFNQIDIIAHFQGDPRLLRDIVSLFTAPEDVSFKKEKDSMKMDVDEPSSPRVDGQSPKPITNGATPNGSAGDEVSLAQRRREVVLLVQQLCIMGKNVQLPARMSLFKCLVDRGIIHAVQWALAQPETTEQGKRMISVAGEILITLLDHDVNGVREHIVRQNEEVGAGSKGESLLNLLCVMMVRSKDLAVQTLVGDALRMVLEMPTPDSNDPVQMPTKLFSRLKDEAKIEKFLDNFYQTSIDTLLKPILDIPEPNHCTESDLVFTRERTNLYLSLCDLLSTFALQHSYRSHFTMIKHSVSIHLITLLHCKDKHLRLAALRYFRVHLKRRNKHFNGHLIKLGVFKALLDLTLEESHRDTLINSCCLELFDTIRANHTHEAYRDIFTHLMTTHEGLVRQLSATKFAGPAFAGLVSRWEMAADTSHKEDQKTLDISSFSNTFDIRRVEEESEDSYFNGDDEDDEDDIDSPPPPLPLTLPNLPNLSPRQHKPKPQTRNWPKRAIGQQKRPITPSPRGLQIPRSHSIDMLMEYGDEDEDLSPVGTIASVNLEEDKNKDRDAFVPSPTPSPDLRPVASNDKEGPPATPRISHRHLSTKRSRDDLERSAADAGTDGDSEEDVGMIGPMPLSPSEEKSSGFTPLRPEKRRRQDDEDEDDMILERLATRGKRSSVGGGESPNPGRQSPGKGGGKDEGAVAAGGATSGKAAGGGGDDSPGQGSGPKKIKLKFGVAGMAVASSSPSPTPESRSEPGTKDGDTG